jgi:hypothetical protein
MKVGSLVVLLGGNQTTPELLKQFGWNVKWMPIADEKTIYTVREMVDIPHNKPGIRLEEGIIGTDKLGKELWWVREYAREIQPPVSSEEIAELVEESCCVEKN